MTHPTNDKLITMFSPPLDDGSIVLSAEQKQEIAALLRELGQEIEEEADYMRPHDETAIYIEKLDSMAARARAIADRLQPTQEES